LAGALIALASLCTLSCRNLDKFDTKPGQVYCGSIGLPAFQEGFIAKNAMPDLELALTLDTGNITSEPGFLRSNDAVNGLCQDPPQALFQNAPLRAIPAVDNDALSELTFGEGHEHDFFVWVDSSCQGTLLGVVSLMKSGQIELRLFKPARLPAVNAKPEARPGFVVFHMAKEKVDKTDPNNHCSF
jgi:hypothetical protein